jgi:putative flippase GtrA
VTWNFFWNRYWTFDARKGSPGRQYMRFFVVAVVAFIVRYALTFLGVERLGIDGVPYYQLLTFSIILIVAVINYVGSRLWAFKER